MGQNEKINQDTSDTPHRLCCFKSLMESESSINCRNETDAAATMSFMASAH